MFETTQMAQVGGPVERPQIVVKVTQMAIREAPDRRTFTAKEPNPSFKSGSCRVDVLRAKGRTYLTNPARSG